MAEHRHFPSPPEFQRKLTIWAPVRSAAWHQCGSDQQMLPGTGWSSPPTISATSMTSIQGAGACTGGIRQRHKAQHLSFLETLHDLLLFKAPVHILRGLQQAAAKPGKCATVCLCMRQSTTAPNSEFLSAELPLLKLHPQDLFR